MRELVKVLVPVLAVSLPAVAGPLLAMGEEGSYNDDLVANASAVLTLLDDMPACWHSCEFTPCSPAPPPVHVNLENWYASDDGPEHLECLYHPQGCLIHHCLTGGGTSAADLVELEQSLRHLPIPQVTELAKTHPSLRINPQRGAVQVYGCDDQVLMSVNLAD